MSEMIQQESIFFAVSFLAGAILFWIYQILIGLRKLFHHSVWKIKVEDFLYWNVAALVIFAAVFCENEGAVRWYGIAAVLAGAWSQWSLLSFFRWICIKLLKKFRNRGKMA